MRGMQPGEPMIQLLTPEGTRVEHPDYAFPDTESDEGRDLLRAMHRDMVLGRRLDMEATALQRHGELGLWPPSAGQEAAQVGEGHALRSQDYVFPSYREHPLLRMRGVDPLEILSVFRGTSMGGWDPFAHDTALFSFVVGAQPLHAVGYAMGVQKDGATATGDPETDMAVVVHFGDGSTSQGDVNEAFVFAASYGAPVVFFCQNNQYAISVPTTRQSPVPFFQRAAGFGFPGVRVDGNDVLACHAVTRAALDHAREGGGPVLIEAYTYRFGAHTTTDDPTRYREKAEEDEWRAKDPIARLEAYLRGSGLADDAFFAAVEQEADELGEYLRTGVKALPEPDPESMFEQVYAETTDELLAEQAAFAAYQEAFL